VRLSHLGGRRIFPAAGRILARRWGNLDEEVMLVLGVFWVSIDKCGNESKEHEVTPSGSLCGLLIPDLGYEPGFLLSNSEHYLLLDQA